VPGTNSIDNSQLISKNDYATVKDDLSANRLFDVQIRNGGRLDIDADFGSIRTFRIGADGQTSDSSIVNHTTGLVRVRDEFIIGHTQGISAPGNGKGQGIYTMSGGTIRLIGGLSEMVTIYNNGVFAIIGQKGIISFDIRDNTELRLKDAATLSYELGTNGVTPIDLSGALTISESAQLSIDASAYEGGEANIPLINYKALVGAFESANVTIKNLDEALSAEITYDDESVKLAVIPEPSAYALLLGTAIILLNCSRRAKNV